MQRGGIRRGRGGNRGGPGEEGAIQLTVDADKREYRKQKKIFVDPLGQSNGIIG
jgi:hypothetical protein